MRVSNIFLLGLTFIFDTLLHLATAEEASFSILQSELAAAEAEIAQQYLVKVKGNGKGKRVLRKLKNGKFDGVELINVIGGRIAVIKIDDDEAESVFRETAMAGIKLMEHDSIMYVDDFFSPEQGRRTAAQDTPYGIELVNAEQVSDAFVSNMKVCIVDSGYDINHEDLPGSPFVTGKSFVRGSWDEDPNSHGTHVAGTIAAIDNGVGVKGVVRSGQMKLHIARVFSRFGFGSVSTIINGFKDCVNEGSNVINMSLGGGGFMQMFQDEINKATNQGVLVVAAAGNSGRNTIEYPASYENVLSVASVDINKQRSSFSTYNDMVDISAPGSDVQSTIPNNGYRAYSGTSMACPHAAGVAALVWSHAPQTPVSEFQQILKDTAEDLGTNGYDSFYGYGLIDAKKAYDSLDATIVPTISPAPSPVSTSDCGSGFSVVVIIKTDDQPQETSWDIIDSTGSTVASKDDYSGAEEYYLDPVCLPRSDGSYTFTIKDSGGNGLKRGSFYRLLVEGERYDNGRRFRGSEKTIDLPGYAPPGPSCLSYDDSSSCRAEDGCFFYQGNCSFCSTLGRIQCGLAGACSWNGSSCE